MKFHLPDYYDKFKCIADKCPDSCCLGWRTIEVDEKSYNKYITGDFLKEVEDVDKHNLHQKLVMELKSIDGKHFFKLENGRCPFLNDNKLCDIIIKAGEQMLCTTCATYPRFIYTKNDSTFACLSMSCPHAARMILNSDEQSQIIVHDSSDPDCEMISIIPQIELLYEDSELPTWMRLVLIALVPVDEESYDDSYAMDIIKDIREFPAYHDIRIQLGIEYLTLFNRLMKRTDRSKRLSQLFDKYIVANVHDIADKVECLGDIYIAYEKYVKKNIAKEVEKEFINFIAYRLYRCIPFVKCPDDFEDEFTMILLSCVAIFMLQAMEWNEKASITQEERITIFQLHAKTFEHSEKMHKKIKEKFKSDGYMTPAVTLALIVPNDKTLSGGE